MIGLLLYALVSAAVGAIAGVLLAGGLSEGAIAGAVVGASIGVIIGIQRNAGSAVAAFEFEAAGIPDDNLITIARRDLVREAYRDNYQLNEREVIPIESKSGKV
ncbi:MAG: hypothetical protein OXE52_05615 [Chloroflexi bacterium]|nr:hypothetical protein [Chloroflexota bacterium]